MPNVKVSLMAVTALGVSAAFGQTHGDLLFDPNFGANGPEGEVFAVHEYGGKVYFGGAFTSVAGFLNARGLASYNPSNDTWAVASGGLSTDAVVLDLEEYNGTLYCIYQTSSSSTLKYSRLLNGVWHALSSLGMPNYDASQLAFLKEYDGNLYTVGFPLGGNCSSPTLYIYNGLAWSVDPTDVVEYSSLSTFDTGSSDVLLCGGSGSNCVDGTVFRYSSSDWQNWSRQTCNTQSAVAELPVIPNSLPTYNGQLYAAGPVTAEDCGTIFYNSGTWPGTWANIGSGPGGDAETARRKASHLTTLSAGSCDWLVAMIVDGWPGSTGTLGWSFDGTSWTSLGLGVPDDGTSGRVVNDSCVVNGWLYLGGNLDLVNAGDYSGNCAISVQNVTRVRSVADWDADGDIDVADASAFIASWNAHDVEADFDCSNSWDSTDSAFFAGRWNSCD